MPDSTLDALLKQRYEIQVQRALLAVDYATNNVNVARADASLERLDVQIREKITGMMQALKLRADMAPTASASKRSDLVDFQVPSEEDQEIARIQQMIQNSPDLINAAGEGGATPLQSAAALGRLKVVNFLLDHGAAIDTGGFPALSRAAEVGNRAMVELLLSRGARVDAAEADGQTALHRAAAHGYLSVVEALLAARPDVNAHDSNRRTPLTMAVENRAVFVATTLLAHGADPNNISVLPFGNNDRKANGTPLHVAVALNDAAMVTLLLTNHSDLTLRNKTGESALDIAASLGETSIARQLVAAGADVNAGSPDNYAPLHRAASSGSREIVALLLEHGANPNVRSKSGVTPLMSAVLSNNGQHGLDVVSVLLQHKADPNLPDLDGSTPLIKAINNRRDVPMVKALLAGGANPDTKRSDGYPPLVLAVAVNNSGDRDMVAALIAAKADVNASDSDGKTPLHWAVDNNRLDLVELLVKAGADVNARTKNGATPLNYAKTSSSSSGQSFPPGGVQVAPLSYQWQLSTAGSGTTNAPTVADILHQNGALDELPDFTRIRITRQGLSSSIEVFKKASTLTNQFTLLETVMRFYAQSSVAVSGVGTRAAYQALPFPDFGRIIIHRPGQKMGKEQEINVNLLNRSNIVDCARDVLVQFGDVIEIPESVHALNADQPDPVGGMEGRALTFADRMRNIQAAAQGNKQAGVSDLNDNPYRPAAACLQKTVQLHVAGDTAMLKVDSWNEGFLSQALNKTEARSILRTSSDLSRVKVTRKTGKSAGPVAFTVDLSQNDNPFWLQDGDVIEVPQKQ